LVAEDDTCFNLAEALHTGRYILDRDESGEIRYFLDYWAVDQQDMELIQNGGRPLNVSTGNSVYVLDFGFKGQYRQIRGEIAKELRLRFPGGQGIAWHHKVKRSEAFKHYPSQRGAQNG